MKKYKIVSLLFGAALLISAPACTNLDEEVYDTIPTSNFGQTPEQIQSLIAPVYKTLRNTFPGDIFCVNEQLGDMAVTPTRVGGDWWDGGFPMETSLRTYTKMNNWIKGAWNSVMDGMSTCNQVYSTIEVSDMDADLKAQTLAEIRGVRAFWVYELMDMWGNGPLVKDFKDVSLPSTTSRADLYAFVVSELNEVKDLLRDDVTTSSAYGKFTKGAAYTLLAKVYLNAEVYTGTPQWQACIDACDEVMKLGYIIEPTWKTNFNPQNQSSKESILEVPYSAASGGNYIHNRTLHYLDPIALGFTKGTWNGISAMPDYVKAFADDDPRKEGSFLMGPILDPATGEVLMTAHGRPLIHTLDFTILKHDSYAQYGGYWGEVNQEDGARCQKWTFEQGMNNTDMENDYHIFRYADIYLMKAECLVRLGKDNATATSLVNTIRERAYGSSDHNYTSVDLEKVYNERKFEFAWEGFARQDQIRMGQFETATTMLRPDVTPKYRELLPIPYTALENNINLTQNPGYAN